MDNGNFDVCCKNFCITQNARFTSVSFEEILEIMLKKGGTAIQTVPPRRSYLHFIAKAKAPKKEDLLRALFNIALVGHQGLEPWTNRL